MPPAAVVAVLFAAGATAAAAPARPRARAEVAVAAPQQPQAPWPGIAELPAHVREHGLQADVEALAGAITTWADRLGGSKASQLARNAFADPLGAPAALLATTDRLDAALRAEPPELHAALAEARAFLALPAPAAARTDAVEPTLLGVKALLAAAQTLAEDALGAIEPADRAELRAGLVTLLDDYLRSIYIHEAKDHDNKRTWKKLQRVDAAGMHAAAELLLPLLQPKVHNALAAALRKELANAPPPPAVPGVTGRLLYAEATPHGWILVGSTDANVYDAKIAFAIDLGGNDTWRAQSTRSDVGVPVNVVLDLAGDDRYLAGEPFAQGCGLFGVSLLGDAAGKDLYEAQRGAQGAAFAGIGVLLDTQGDDRFTADAFAQGIALHGTGLLLDRAGNDAMTLGSDGQGYGLPQGVGVLGDLAGNDQRTATGMRKSTYGTDGEFVGRAQGTAFGFRTVAPGGLGALLDGGGKDVYETGSDLAFARCGHADDVGRGSKSIALFLDLGGGKDSYPATSPLQPPPGNGSVAVRTREDAFGDGDAKKTATSGKGVFVDR